MDTLCGGVGRTEASGPRGRTDRAGSEKHGAGRGQVGVKSHEMRVQGQHVKAAEESKPAGQRGEMLRIPAAEAAAGRGGSGPGQGWQGETRYDARPQVTFTRAGSGEGRERPTTAGCEIKRERETRSLCQRHRHRVRCATPTDSRGDVWEHRSEGREARPSRRSSFYLC